MAWGWSAGQFTVAVEVPPEDVLPTALSTMVLASEDPWVPCVPWVP
jgi:hypothetical protein